MHLKSVVFAGAAGAFVLAGSASADLVQATLATVDLGAAEGDVTYRIYLDFDSPTQLLAVRGTTETPLVFSTDTVIVNDGGAFTGLKAEDFAQSPIAAAFDSFVTINATGFAGNDTDYSPTFLDNDGLNNVIQGSFFSDDDDGWFDSNPGTPEIGASMLIAQFTVADGGNVTLSGLASWVDDQGELVQNAFEVSSVPAPGALTLLGLAGLAGVRRRRG